mgnify:CR=1 FL=1
MDETTLNQKQADDCEIVVDQGKKTFVIVAAQHIDPTKNYLNKVPCKKGVPLVGHVYDAKFDSYFLPCVDFLLLGTVNAAAYLKSKSNQWSIRIPLSVPVLSSFVEPTQRIDLRHFLDSYNPEDHVFHYLQLIDANELYPPVKT